MIVEALRKRLIYRQWKLTVYTQGFRIPGGQVIERLIVGANLKPVIIVPITDEGKLVMVRQYRYAAMKYILEFPGGLVNRGESPIEVAKRELEEETGYTSDTFIKVADRIWFDPAMLRISFAVWVALHCCKMQKAPKMDFDEVISESCLMDPGKLEEIEDSKTLAAISLARKYLDYRSG